MTDSEFLQYVERLTRGEVPPLPEDAPPPAPPPIDPSHGGDDDGGMEARVAKLEAVVEHIQSDIGEIKRDIREIRSDARVDFRITWGAMIFGFLGIAGLMAHGFHWL